MTALAAYTGLFAAAFLAATILPMQSEAVLVGLLLSDAYTPWMLIFVASVGNVLGSVVNWLLGRQLETYQDKKWFPVKPAALERARNWYHRYGRWTLLLSWMPIIGDPITVSAGVMRESIHIFLPLVTLVKVGRYLVLAAVVLRYTL